MKKKVAFHLFFLIAALPMLAQQKPQINCATETPSKEWEEQFQQLVRQYLTDVKDGRITQAVREIPVIVHVIHGGQAVETPPNLSAVQINSQIQVLNDDVEGNGFNVQNIPYVFEKDKADLNIKFMMATIDTMGVPLPEPGIHRVHYNTLPGGKDPKIAGYGADGKAVEKTFMKFINDTIKTNTIWNPKKYFNIWITETKIDTLGGFATFPANSGLDGINANYLGTDVTDGVWCNVDIFGLLQSNSSYNSYNMGRAMSHEAGHWLGFLHVFEGVPCSEDDKCADTPPVINANTRGIHPHRLGKCVNNTTGEMFMNFMDNSVDSLKFMFTNDQNIRAQTCLINGTHRKDLGTHNLVAAVTVPIADYDVSDPIILKGKEITFKNTSLGTPDTYLWDFGKDAEPQTSALKDPPPIKYSTSGIKMISLTVTNKAGSNFTRRAKIVKGCVENVLCADFEALVDGMVKSAIEINEAIYFKNLSSGNPTSWSWEFEGGTPATSTERNPRIVYKTTGSYKVKLSIVSANGNNSIEKKNYINVNASYNTGVAYTCIAIDSARNIWAGTNKAGVFFLNKKANPSAVKFDALPAGTVDFSKLVVQSIACDTLGNTWVAHGGTGGNIAGGGGMERIDFNNINTIQHYSPDRNALGFTFLERDGLGTLNIQCVRVDKNSTVWTANKYHDLTEGSNYIITPGGMSYKAAGNAKFTSKSTWKDYQAGNESSELPYPAYTYNPKITESPQTRTCSSIGCGMKEVWLCSNPYIAKNGTQFPSRIVRYDLNGNFIAPSIDFKTLGLTAGGLFNGIYISPKDDAWATIFFRGFGVRTNGIWQFINLADMACIFPAGLVINQNAIWGNKFGNVFIGTTKGLIVYKGDGNVNSVNSYSFYPLSKVKGTYRSVTGGVAEYESIQWMATDDGIIRTVIGKYDMTKDDIDYTSCNKPDINEVEAAIKTGGADLSFHTYEITTEVCDVKTTAYPNHCNAEHVYSMLKNDVNLTIPNPYDYPLDVLNNVYKKENKNILFSLLTKTPFEKAIEALTNSSLSAEQKNANPSKVLSCQEYKLYNSSTSILARHLYDKGPMLTYFKDCKWSSGSPFDYAQSMDDYCGNKLEKIEYDRIWIFPNDKKKSITNYTAKGHILYPGKIERTVVEECGKVKIVTKGIGKQYCGDNCRGELMKKANVVIGKYLFTKVDERLVTSFNNGN